LDEVIDELFCTSETLIRIEKINLGDYLRIWTYLFFSYFILHL